LIQGTGFFVAGVTVVLPYPIAARDTPAIGLCFVHQVLKLVGIAARRCDTASVAHQNDGI
jgi:hypothetical protein